VTAALPVPTDSGAVAVSAAALVSLPGSLPGSPVSVGAAPQWIKIAKNGVRKRHAYRDFIMRLTLFLTT
jgi:hypothetical protein